MDRVDSARRHRRVWGKFEELGIADWATLQATESCPTNILGEGRLVTGTFEYSSGEVLNLFIAGESKGRGTRSDIDFRIDTSHPGVNELISDLKKVGDDAGSASLRHGMNHRAATH